MDDELQNLEETLARVTALESALGPNAAQAIRMALRTTDEASRRAHGLTPEMRGERKLATVIFADLSGFTALSEKLDAEVVRDLMNGCFDCLVPVIEKYGGTIDKFIGDEIMALFGAPHTQEDHAERALNAALEMMSNLRVFNQQHSTQLGMHIGINSGMVVAGGLGSVGRQTYSVLGDTVNVAARLEDASTSGDIFVGPQTYLQCAPLFEFETLPPMTLKGKSAPLAIYRLLRLKEMRGRLRGLTDLDAPLVGRQAELARLLGLLQNLRNERGGLGFIFGEAGLGKSRLLKEARQFGGTGVTWFESAALSYEIYQPYTLFQRLFRQVCGLYQTENAALVLERIRPMLKDFSAEAREDALQALGGLFALGGAATQSGETFRARLFKFMGDFWRMQCAQNPVTLVFDDLHWADPASVELLQHLLPLCGEVPLLLLFGSRPDAETPGWRLKAAGQDFPEVCEIFLQPLNASECDHLVHNLLSIMDLSPRLQERIQARAEGNPLFIEELVRTLIEKHVIVFEEKTGHWLTQQDPDQIELPTTLQALLSARIDRLDAAPRSTLQMASVIGRQFYARVLASILTLEKELPDHLETLQRVELIEEAARNPELAYIFRHVLMQEAAYQSILHQQRREFHRQVAETLENLFADQRDEYAATLAYHFSAAEMPVRSFFYLCLAGNVAFQMHAIPEAGDYYRRAVALTAAADTTFDEIRAAYLHYGRTLELTNQYPAAVQAYQALATLGEEKNQPSLALAAWIALAKIHALPCPVRDPEQAALLIDRATALARELGDLGAEARVLWVKQLLYMYTGRMRQSVLFGEQAIGLAQQVNDIDLLAYAGQDVALGYMVIGRLDLSGETLEMTRTLWGQLGNMQGLTENYANHTYLYIMLGRFKEALEMADRASQLAMRITNEWGRANASIFIGLLHLACGNVDQTFELLEEISPMAHAIGHPGSILCEVQMGWIYLSVGAQEQAIAHMQRADEWAQTFPPFLIASQAGLARSALTTGNLAAAKQFIDDIRNRGLFETLLLFDQMFELTVLEYHVTCREWAEARQQADRLLNQMDDYRVQYGLPVALQLKAEIELAEGKPDLALTCLQKAVELSTALNAQTWLWPALARLAAVHEGLGQQNEADAARARAVQSLQHIATSTVRPELRQSLAAHAATYGLSFSLDSIR